MIINIVLKRSMTVNIYYKLLNILVWVCYEQYIYLQALRSGRSNNITIEFKKQHFQMQWVLIIF